MILAKKQGQIVSDVSLASPLVQTAVFCTTYILPSSLQITFKLTSQKWQKSDSLFLHPSVCLHRAIRAATRQRQFSCTSHPGLQDIQEGQRAGQRREAQDAPLRLQLLLSWMPDHQLWLSCLPSRQIKYRQVYEQEMRGKASTEVGAAEAVHARENGENFSQVMPGSFHLWKWLFKYETLFLFLHLLLCSG